MFDETPVNRLCSNIIRKTVSTVLREENNPLCQEAADAMAHSKSTADKDYFVRDFEKRSLVGSTAITDVFHTPKKKKRWMPDEIEKIEDVYGHKLELVTLEEVRSSPLQLQASPKQVNLLSIW